MKKLTRLTFLMLLLLTLKTNVSLGKNTSQIIMPINDDLSPSFAVSLYFRI